MAIWRSWRAKVEHKTERTQCECAVRSASIDQRGREITFLYKLVDGRAHRSYGLNVARLAGLEPGIISLAQERSGDLEREMRLKRTIGQVRVLLRANGSDEHGEGEGRDEEALLQTWLRIQRQISSTTAR